MSKIVTLGGGEFTRGEVEKIDRYALDLTGKYDPKVLYIPTASNDEERDLMTEYYRSFGISKYEILCLINDNPSDEEIQEKIFSADYIFAGGGDAILLMDVWKKYGVDSYIRQAYYKDIVLSGISAGSICYYEIGHTDSLSYHHENWDYCRMHGTGVIPAIHSPHFNEHRNASLENWMKSEALCGIGLEDNCALVGIDGKFSVFTSNETAKAHVFKNLGGKVTKELLYHNDTLNL